MDALLQQMGELAEEAGDWQEHLPYEVAEQYLEDRRYQQLFASHVDDCSYCQRLVEALHPREETLALLLRTMRDAIVDTEMQDLVDAETKDQVSLDAVKFRPWVGEHYGRTSRFGLRVLVLGESHYGKPEQDGLGYTQRVVRQWAKRDRSRFFTVISKVLLCTTDWIDDEARGEVWDHIAFYNFVQELVGEAPRSAPKFRQWVEAQGPFKTVVEYLRPDALLVLGRRLEGHLLEMPEGVDFAVIGHPSSSGMRYDDAIPQFEHLMARARNRVAGVSSAS